MRIVTLATWILVAAACLAGCSSASQSGVAPIQTAPNAAGLAMSQMALSRSMMPPPAIVPDHNRSWVAPDTARADRLVFITDPGTDDVDIFALPDLTLKGKLTGLREPLGECADNHGNVWIANYLRHEMLEYSRKGMLLNKIRRAHLAPYSCAVDPTSGALAVMDIGRPNAKPGEVLVYSSPSATPVILRNPVQLVYYFGTYDPSGNLWVGGLDALGHFILSKCVAKSCSTVSLSGGSIFSAGAVDWDPVGGTLVVFDEYCRETPNTCSYPISSGGVLGTPTTYFSNIGATLCFLPQAVLVRTGKKAAVVGADNEYVCGYGYAGNTVNRWAYPSGGTPQNDNEGSLIYPYGAAVSTK